ncbi:hypothetical protein ACUOFC_67210, partial [Escherichia sp. TWPC-MK]
AAKITSIPAEKIIQLAREIGSAKPAYICQGWGPQRHSNGEQTSRAIAMLSDLSCQLDNFFCRDAGDFCCPFRR